MEKSEATSAQSRPRDDDWAERVRTAAAKEAPKHKRLLRSAGGGRVLSAVMLPFVTVRPPSGYGVLTTTGRRTGKVRRKLEQAREAICETVVPNDYGECALHLRGRPTREKIKELHRYWFDTGIPVVVELKETRTGV